MQRTVTQRHVTLRRPMTRPRTQVHARPEREPKWNYLDWGSVGMIIAVVITLMLLR